MAATDPINLFVHDALAAGRSRAEIQNALGDAGWSGSEIEKALSAFADVTFTPPVPRPRPQLTARDVFVYAMLFTALGFTATYLINLIHGNLDLWLHDAADHKYWMQRAKNRIRWAIAILFTSTPVFVWLTIYTGRRVAQDAAQKRSLVRKWLTYLALFVSALVFFGDATYVIYNFLKGEITLRFILKAATVAGVSLAIFIFYLRDVEDMKDGE
ncbi:MAG: hypothetical protein GY742_00315 [Hyphomicrobiales bacterium]|nr:hypothetical protein [Hyphomicrobiales bacterium]